MLASLQLAHLPPEHQKRSPEPHAPSIGSLTPPPREHPRWCLMPHLAEAVAISSIRETFGRCITDPRFDHRLESEKLVQEPVVVHPFFVDVIDKGVGRKKLLPGCRAVVLGQVPVDDGEVAVPVGHAQCRDIDDHGLS